MTFALLLQARKLEAQLDEQMNSYRKLVSSKASTKNDSEENDIESGIDRLLKQLQQVNMKMQDWVSSGGSEMVSHTLTRHQEILQDLTQVLWFIKYFLFISVCQKIIIVCFFIFVPVTQAFLLLSFGLKLK